LPFCDRQAAQHNTAQQGAPPAELPRDRPRTDRWFTV
jgi:hypothetical protein